MFYTVQSWGGESDNANARVERKSNVKDRIGMRLNAHGTNAGPDEFC